jgi:uncharacterized protein (TIGR00299 family) protein
MRIAFFDCFAGISGDMILGALVDVGVDIGALREALSGLPISGYEITHTRVLKRGIAATSVSVHCQEPQTHRNLQDIIRLLSESTLPPQVINRSIQTFRRLAQAEAKVHGTTPDQIHFHEVGAVDSIIDIVGCMIGLEWLGISEIKASRIPMSYGRIECTHGILPLPAPATMELLRGVPTFPSGLEGELVTPTGAALLTTLANHFGDIPPLTIDRVGYGAGQKDFPIANVLRLIIGESTVPLPQERMTLLETNIDDMNPEIFEYVMQRLLEAGAADVYLTPVYMKKNRPGVVISVLAHHTDVHRLTDILLAETTTLGVRFFEFQRRCLERETLEVTTPFGEITVKVGRRGESIVNIAPEYEDCRAAAARCQIPLYRVYEAAHRAAEAYLGTCNDTVA